MKNGIHPKYYPDARVVCSCGHVWTTGSTRKELRVDVCSNCHPFYTGEQRIVDTAGQVDRFYKRLNRFSDHQVDAVKRQTDLRQKMEQRFLKQQIIALDLSDNIFQVLHDANVITVGDLVKKIESGKNSLLTLAGFNDKVLADVESKLREAKSTYFAEAV